MPIRRELLRAYVTRRMGHGERHVVTRAYLSDGTVEQRVNPGRPDDDEISWEKVGRYDDLVVERDRLRRAGWAIERRDARQGARRKPSETGQT